MAANLSLNAYLSPTTTPTPSCVLNPRGEARSPDPLAPAGSPLSNGFASNAATLTAARELRGILRLCYRRPHARFELRRAAAAPVQAVILAGGRGRRLRPITDYVPKPLVPVANVPILEWQLRYLESHGVSSAVLCTGYRAGQIRDYLSTRGGRGRIRAAVSEEREPLGTGGAIRGALGAIRGRSFIVLNGDVITDIDAGRLRGAAGGGAGAGGRGRRREPDVAIAAIPLRTQFGIMQVGGAAEGGRAGGARPVTGFLEKAPLRDKLMNAGVYHMARDAASELPARGDIERTLFPKYAAAGRLSCVVFEDARWYSIDSFKDVEECGEHAASIIKRGGPRRR